MLVAISMKVKKPSYFTLKNVH